MRIFLAHALKVSGLAAFAWMFSAHLLFAATSGTGQYSFPPGGAGGSRLLIGLGVPGTGEINGGTVVNSSGNSFTTAAYVGVDGGNGSLLITGAGSQLNMLGGNALRIGANAPNTIGQVTVTLGGAINLQQEALVVGSGDRNRGTLTVNNSTVNVGNGTGGNPSLYVGINGSTAGYTSEVFLQNASTMNIGNTMQIGGSGANNQGIVTLSGGSTLNVASVVYLGFSGSTNHGEVRLVGAGNTLNVDGNTYLNFGQGTGRLYVESGNTITLGALTLQGSDVGSPLPSNSGAGTIQLAITDWNTWNPIQVETTLNLNSGGGSHLLVDLVDDLQPNDFAVGDIIDLITYGSYTGAPFDLVGSTISQSGFSFLVGQDANSVFLEVTEAVVPEPTSLAMWGLFGLVIGGVFWRHRACAKPSARSAS